MGKSRSCDVNTAQSKCGKSGKFSHFPVEAVSALNIKKKPIDGAPGPDKGWAWIVAFACFFINFILAGLARSSGILYVALIELYGVSREAATTPFSIRVCVRNLVGPAVGMLGQRYGIRFVTLLGGITAGLGGVLCSFAPDILWMTVFWGGINGLGFGLSTVVHMMVINQYFDKYKATALGIGYSGDCFGSFILPSVIEFLLSKYDVRETFMIIGGLAFNVVPMAMLLRAPPWIKDQKRSKKSPYLTESEIALPGKLSVITDGRTITGYENQSFVSSEISLITLAVGIDNKMTNSLNKADACTTSEIQNEVMGTQAKNGCKTQVQRREKLDATMTSNEELRKQSTAPNIGDKPVCYKEEFEVNTECETDAHPKDTEEDIGIIAEFAKADEQKQQTCRCDCKLSANDKTASQSNVSGSDAHDKERRGESITKIIVENISEQTDNCGKKNCLTTTITGNCESGTVIRIRTLSESLRDSRDSKSKISCEAGHSHLNHPVLDETISPESTAVKLDNELYDVVQVSQEFTIAKDVSPNTQILNPRHLGADASKLKNVEHVIPEVASGHHSGNNMKSIFKNILNSNLKPIFLLISITAAAYCLLFVSVVTVIIDFNMDKGFSPSLGKYLLIGFSATDLVGRLGFGIVIDRRWVKMHHYASFTITFMGLSVAAMPFANSFLLLMATQCFYGLIQGASAIMYPILIDRYMEKDQQSISMGCLSFYAGVLMFAMAPMIGFFRDSYGSYDGVFYITGISTATIGLLWLLEPIIVRCQKGVNHE